MKHGTYFVNQSNMSIDKYINWEEIWDNEVCLDIPTDNLPPKQINLIDRFREETDLELLFQECSYDGDLLHIYWGESGGQNESDTQGWSRDYLFILDEDFIILDVIYSQG